MTGLEMKYFVLKPAGEDAYAIASRTALKAYASAIEKENPSLAYDLHMWRIDEQGNANTAVINRQFESDVHDEQKP